MTYTISTRRLGFIELARLGYQPYWIMRQLQAKMSSDAMARIVGLSHADGGSTGSGHSKIVLQRVQN